jgi:arsenate reductase
MNTPVRVAERPAKSSPPTVVRDDIEPFIKSTRSSNMRYLVALLFCRPRTLNGISSHLIESQSEHGDGGAVDPKRIDDSASPRSYSLARIWSLILLLTTVFMGATSRAEDDSTKPATFVFVCLHGSVKSQIATAHFNRIARERGLPVIAVSRGIAVDNKIPAAIREGLAGDGLAPATDVPVGLTSQQAAAATKIFAFDDVPTDLKGDAEVTYWSDVPPATEDYVRARSEIVRHLEEMVASMSGR